MKSTQQARQIFLDYFSGKGHEVRPSSSLVPHNDPTLMFTNAGMNQFKNVFTGAETLSFSRAATSQKCVRAGGKHNDLDNVGYTARHHTFFEMLGNFSFGDYFKEEAIFSAWELLTKEYGIDKDKLSFTVYHTDDEAFDLWKKITGCEDGRILRVPTKDNFWSMGDTGPCGPCSEIFYDHGERAGQGEWALNADGSDKFDDRFVEIWNLVFMQYEQIDENTRNDLPKPSIDTGMGLERITAVLQGVYDNYDIDLFKSLIAATKKLAPNDSKEAQVSYRVIADHLRSSCFLMADGILPSNEGRGYVLRRIMRRAMRHVHHLGAKEPLMYKLVAALITEMGDAYPELKRAEAVITENLRAEEERFKETLDRGLKLLDEEVQKLSSCGEQREIFSGEAAFKLYDTYGFPLDLTQDILKGRGIEVDVAGFDKAMEGQRDMARASHKGSGDAATGKIWFALKEKIGNTTFLGYEQDSAEATVKAIVKDGAEISEAAAGDEVFIVLDQTPFYGESGGQIGDTGWFYPSLRAERSNPAGKNWIASSSTAPRNDALAEVLDTRKPVEDLYVHHVLALSDIKKGDIVYASIDTKRRDAIRANHSATHLLHKALHDVLGEHVTQKGSLVAPDRLRFDFSHGKALTPEEKSKIEHQVNAAIKRASDVACVEMAPDDAIKAGAMALFGEKYGDKVRVLSMGETESGDSYSVELCGGTHVKNTGDIGLFAITSEGSVASGIRRIEAVTGDGVREYFMHELNQLQEELSRLTEENTRLLSSFPQKRESSRLQDIDTGLRGYDEIKNAPYENLHTLYHTFLTSFSEAIELLMDENKKLTKQLAESKKKDLLENSKVEPEKLGNVQFIIKAFDGLEPKELRSIAEAYLKQIEPGIVAVGTSYEGKASIVVGVDQFLTDMYNAATLVQQAVSIVGGKGGGGKPTMAQGGGPDTSKLDEALQSIKSSFK